MDIFSEWNNDREVVIMAVQQDDFLLECASDELRKDKEVVLLAMANDFISYNFSLLEGYKIIDEVVNKEGEEFLFSYWNNDKRVVLAAVKKWI